MLTYLIAATLAAVPQQDDWMRDRAASAELGAMAKGCELDYETGLTRGINYRHEVDRYLRAMLKDSPACPGLAQKAAAWVIAAVGTPERADVDFEMLERAWMLVRAGRLVRGAPSVERRYARMLWLFDDRPAYLRPDKAEWVGTDLPEWQKWSETAGAVALLAARNERRLAYSPRTLLLEAALRLRRDLPHYDPQRAAELLERGMLSTGHAARQRVSKLWTDGVHLPPDYLRAARPYRFTGETTGTVADEGRRELLAIGKQAAAAARTQADRIAALNILFGAALTRDAGALVTRDALLKQLGRIRNGELAPGDAERTGRAIDWNAASAMASSGIPKPATLHPIRLRGLIGPDGRLVMAVVSQSSGSVDLDRIALGTWFNRGEKADLSATARGRLVWVDLPAIDPRMSSSEVWTRWNK